MKYKILYQENNQIKKLYLESDNLQKEKLPQNIIKIKEYKKSQGFPKSKKISNKELDGFFKELNIMLNANISLKESFTILAKNRRCEKQKSLALTLLHNLNNSKGMQSNLKQFKLDSLISSFFEIVNKKGNLKLSLQALSALLAFKLEFKKQLIKTFSYPILLLLTLFVSLFCIFYFVLPSFESLINQNALKANSSTVLLFALKDFILQNSIYLFLFLLVLIVVTLLFYRINKNFAFFIDKVLILHFPIIRTFLFTFELYKIFIVLNILQKANYEFHDSLNSLDVLVKNKYLLDKIAHIKNLLKSGRSISYAFKTVNLFDDVVLNLIHTGEVSNQMLFTTKEIEKIYQIKFEQRVKLFSFWVQPLVFMLIMGLILWIIFAIFMPMWNMSEMIMI